MAIFKYDPLPLKEVEETQEQHPWARTIKDVYSYRIKHAHNSISNPNYPGKEKKQPEPDRVRFTVIGDRVTKEFTYCSNLVKGLYKYRWKNFYVPVIRGCNTIEWPEILRDLKLRFKGIPYCLQSSVAVLFNNMIIGGEKELQQLVETKLFYYLCLDYYNEGVAEFTRFIQSTSRPFAYMHVSIDDKHVGTLIYMLYADKVPYTCENFLRLCKETKGGYGGTPVHRIVKDGWIQCGGFGLKSAPLCCENFMIPFDRRGVLAMANDGRHDDCSTQFFVTLQPAPWMNHKYVAFGQLIEGAATLEKIESVTTWYESPISKIILYRCGILNMECHDIRINKEADQYIDGHIEDLNSLVELLWEHLLEKTFLEAQLRELERMRAWAGEATDASSEYGESTKMPERNADENHEEEDDYYKYQSLKSVSQVVKTHRPYYIPLTDVPYPGDVESDFDLKKFLKGDYCLESDLSTTKEEVAEFPLELWDPSPYSSSSDELSLGSEEQLEIDRYITENVNEVSFAGVVIKSIAVDKSVQDFARYFVRYYSHAITDEKLRRLNLASAGYEKKKIKKKHFGGGYGDDVKPTSFDNKDKDNDVVEPEKSNSERKSDPKLKFRCTTQNGSQETEPSKGFLKRRLTAFVRPGDIPVDNSDDDDDDDDDEGKPAPQPSFTPKSNLHKSHFATHESPEETALSQALMHDAEPFAPQNTVSKTDEESTTKPFTFQKSNDDKDPTMKPSITAQRAGLKFADEDVKHNYTLKRRATAFVHASDIPELDDDDDDDVSEHEVRGSVLKRLYDEVDNDEPGPTLKNYKPTAELQNKKNTKLLPTHSVLLPATSEESFEQFANTQHGTTLYNKISTDYVKTIDKLENRFSHSIRSMEYAKKRPTISVSQYQLMNRQYQEALERKATPL